MSLSTPRPPALDRLNVFIGRWLTEGATVATPTAPSVRILASDIYEWAPGGEFIVHPVYSRIGERDFGGLEVIAYDPSTNQFRTHFFDRTGRAITETLTFRDDSWIWQGDHHRCTGTISEDGRTITARHEVSDDGLRWSPSMTVTLQKVE